MLVRPVFVYAKCEMLMMFVEYDINCVTLPEEGAVQR